MPITGVHKPIAKSVEWWTPPEIIEALGPFDLDPCAGTPRPWNTAKVHYDSLGLTREWFGRVWLNPPYGPETIQWIRKLAEHRRGTALIFARTETKIFFPYVWDLASGILFLKGRLHFYTRQGLRMSANSGGPSALIAYGDDDAERLKSSGIAGRFISL
jgi:hypothetical protein